MLITETTSAFGDYPFGETGNEDFKRVIDSIDLGGKTGAEYRDAKLVLLSGCYTKDDHERINIITYGRILLHGVRGALDNTLETIFDCQAGEKLGLAPVVEGELSSQIERNRAKIQYLHPVMLELSSIAWD